jgi:hypothetical protein
LVFTDEMSLIGIPIIFHKLSSGKHFISSIIVIELHLSEICI